MKLYYCTCTQSFSNFFVSLQGLPICDDGGPSLPSRCLSSLAAASVSFVLGGEGPCMQLSTATRCLNRRSTQFKPCLQRIGEANCVEVHPRTKTIHRCCHHCHHHHRPLLPCCCCCFCWSGANICLCCQFCCWNASSNFGSNWWWLVLSIVTAVHSAEGLPCLCLHGSHLVVSSSRCC